MRKKEFYDIMYKKEEKDVEEYSEKICNQQNKINEYNLPN